MGKKPPDPEDEGYDSLGEIPTLGGDDNEEEERSEEETDPKEEEKEKNSINTEDNSNMEKVPPDPTEGQHSRTSLNLIKSDNPNLCIIETCNNTKADDEDLGDNVVNCREDANISEARSSSLYEHFIKFGPGPRDLQEIRLMNMKEEDKEENDFHCDLCFHEGKPIRIVKNHVNRCPTCPSMTPSQKVRMFGPHWKQQAEMIIKTRYNREKGRD